MIMEIKDQPDVVALFRNLLKYGMIDGNKGEDEAIFKCHCHGWIHADQMQMRQWYIAHFHLPSTAFLSWRLETTNNMPHLTSLFNLALNAISKFKSSWLYLPIHCIGHRSQGT